MQASMTFKNFIKISQKLRSIGWTEENKSDRRANKHSSLLGESTLV